MVLHESASFELTLSAAQAPTSCGAMYWDPLLAPHDFYSIQYMHAPPFDDGSSSSSSSGDGALELGHIIAIAAAVVIVVAVFCAVMTENFCNLQRCRRDATKAGSQKGEVAM